LNSSNEYVLLLGRNVIVAWQAALVGRLDPNKTNFD
jgi:hypothetical protein